MVFKLMELPPMASPGGRVRIADTATFRFRPTSLRHLSRSMLAVCARSTGIRTPHELVAAHLNIQRGVLDGLRSHKQPVI
ncbi:hypothetical protein [Bradyrhizobium sp. USDA 4451]